MSSFLGALTDAWGKGLSAWRALDPKTEGGASPFGAMFPGAGPGPSAGASPAGVPQADMSPAIAQAGLVAAASTMRYWRALAELQARYRSSLMHAVADRGTAQAGASPEDCRVLADELRAFLREVGDAAMQEARRLQRELEEVGESIAQVADQVTPSPHYPPDQERPHRRPHHVKE